MIAGTIKGVISQRLVPGADGGRVAVCEILRMTGPCTRHDHRPRRRRESSSR